MTEDIMFQDKAGPIGIPAGAGPAGPADKNIEKTIPAKRPRRKRSRVLENPRRLDVLIEAEDYQKLDEISRKTNLAVSELVRRAIKEFIKRCEG